MGEKRLILPGETKPGMTLLVPKGYESAEPPTPAAVCRIPVGEGELCGFAVYHHEHAWERKIRDHWKQCVERHRQEIHEASPRTRMPVFDEANWDPEVASHLKEVGKRMLREGRLELRPNERAGL